MRLRRPGLGFLVALISVTCHLPALRNRLVWDDAGTIPQKATLWSALGRSFWTTGTGTDQYYRPFVTLMMAIDRVIGGGKTWYFHLTNVVLHAVVIFLFYRALVLLGRSSPAAALGAFDLGTHRLTADSVAYVSGRTDLLAGLGLVLALNGMLQHVVSSYRCSGRVQVSQPYGRHDWLILGGFAIATGAKENSLLLPVLVVLWLAAHRLLRRSWLLVVGLLLVCGIYLACRIMVLGSVFRMELPEAGDFVVLSLNSSGYLLAQFVLPVGALFFWSPGVLARFTPWLLLGLVVLALPVAFVWRTDPDWRAKWLLMWGWSVLFLLPFAGVMQFGPVGRFFYVPGMGWVALLVLAGLRFATSRRRTVVVAGIAVVWFVVMVPSLWWRISWWRDEVTLFSRMTVDAPGYAQGFHNLGTALVRSGDSLGAEAAYRRALALDSELVSTSLNLGALLLARNEPEQAVAIYRAVVQRRPDFAPAYANLGIGLYRLGDKQGAIEALRQAADMDPANLSIAYNLSRLYRLVGEVDSSVVWQRRVQEWEGEK
ncbi:MAG: tetratricopeptide repeat protein [candidate division WOR-3 bacterium]